MSEKLHKVLARAGLGSRREIEGWISQGRVSVNGRRASLGERVRGEDLIRVDGKRVRSPVPGADLRVLRYHKPAGEVCTRRDPQSRPSVFDRLPRLSGARWVAVGRLDFNTSGLLLFTNHGELAERLMHPSRAVPREYAVRVRGELTPEGRRRLLEGVRLADGPARCVSIVKGGGRGTNHWYKVVVVEGRNREVRRLWESQGLPVSRLIRVRFGPVSLPRRLASGRFELLGPGESTALLEAAGLGREGTGVPRRAHGRGRRTSPPGAVRRRRIGARMRHEHAGD